MIIANEPRCKFVVDKKITEQVSTKLFMYNTTVDKHECYTSIKQILCNLYLRIETKLESINLLLYQY